MQKAGQNYPLGNERTPEDGPDQADQAVDDTIRLNWREKLVEGGLVMVDGHVRLADRGIGRP